MCPSRSWLDNYLCLTIMVNIVFPGASFGIGAGTAILFAKYGSRLALTGRNKQKLEAVASKCEEQGLSKDKVISQILQI